MYFISIYSKCNYRYGRAEMDFEAFNRSIDQPSNTETKSSIHDIEMNYWQNSGHSLFRLFRLSLASK